MRKTIYALLLTIFTLTVSSCTEDEIKPITRDSSTTSNTGGGSGMPGPL